MKYRVLTMVGVLAVCGSTLAVAQRTGSVELTASGGAVYAGKGFDLPTGTNASLGFGGLGRIGFNFSPTLGISGGLGVARVNALTVYEPFVAATYTMNLDAKTSPFATVGVGITRIGKGNVRRTSTYDLNFGVGVRSFISQNVAVRVDAILNYDNFTDGQSALAWGTVGLSYFLAGRPAADTDMDGVSDRSDACAATPRGATVDARGCPADADHDGVWNGVDRCASTPANTPVDATGCPRDTDRDGVADNMDRCANTPAGTRVDASGCSVLVDADHDGVSDTADRCPNTPADARPVDAAGCPVDADHDGVADYMDNCPNSPAGSAVGPRGCPLDTDGDSVPDSADRCPNTVAGARVDAAGCPVIPDSDNDGVPDNRDRCANSPRGRPVNSVGCTLISLPTSATDQMLLRVQFVTSRSNLVSGSTAVLDSVAEAIIATPGSTWEVQGYTDSRGSVAMNQRLSQARAQSVVDYLVSKGVPRASMTARGYASERPVASNDTVEGRAANRRVQLVRRAPTPPNPLP